ncbi:hypothetical protein [Terracoccus sp. 273MFTsu3.1]|uniref:hypothetical protein n=1 Tax=Terracoccus sp. 273MFTsu3.1 TaxID=1172188 RepID=UPI00037168A5|nr:hypothetical protein [Terracoccus sp. 273MFTsu3.1]
MRVAGLIPTVAETERVTITAPDGLQYAVEVVQERKGYYLRVSTLDGTPLSSHHPASYPFQSVLLVGPRS